MTPATTKTNIRMSLYRYWLVHVRGFRGYQYFVAEYRVLMKDPEFVKKFGAYKGRALSEKQIKLLNEELTYYE
jgi:hypothetical protein